MKLIRKTRVGSRLKRLYEAPRTPWQRLLAGGQGDPLKIAQLKNLFQPLDPFELSGVIDRKLEEIYGLSSSVRGPGVPRRKVNALFNTPEAGKPLEESKAYEPGWWYNPLENPVWKIRKSHAKEKFLAGS